MPGNGTAATRTAMADVRVAINAWFWEQSATGSGQYVRCLIRHLSTLREGLDIVLVAPRGRAEEITEGALPPQARVVGIRLPPGMPVALAKVWFEQLAFPRACAHLQANVAHVPYWAPPWRGRVPTVTTIHDLIPLLLPEYRGGALVRLYTGLVSAAARRAPLVLTDSEAARRDIIAHLGLEPTRVRAVPLAADSRFTPTPSSDDAAVRARLGVPPRYVLYLGGFDVRKNLALALRACQHAAPAVGPDCPLVIAGRLPERDSRFTPDPRRLARELSFDPASVRFGAPSEADKPALYRGAQVFLFPSRYEGFGLPPLEALACGTPVVGSHAAALPEVVGSGGLLFSPDDAAGMGAALAHVLSDPGLRNELGRRAIAQAARFSWERTARETLRAYRDLATAIPPRA
jgi:glycosyltransferase involved in cell wall biosynthesis